MIEWLLWMIIGGAIIGLFLFNKNTVEHDSERKASKVNYSANELVVIVSAFATLIVRASLTFAVGSVALYIIFSNDTYSDSHQKWAFGAVGTIIGYWFKK